MSDFLNIPTSSQWVTFPTTSSEKMSINWEDNLHSYVNTYYVAKCYFGILDPPKVSVANTKLQVPTPIYIKDNTKLTVLGETKIYIAAEFIEEEYADSPSDLGHFHLRDIARSAVGDKKSSWVTMKLNGAFCYGQNGKGSKLRRYIVYHPSVGPGIRRPNIYQHRFTDTEMTTAISNSLEGATEDMPEKYKLLGAALSQIIKVVHKKGKAALGDALWVFLDDDRLSKVYEPNPVPKFPWAEADLRKHLAQIQKLEFGGVGKEARDSRLEHLLAPPGNEAPFVPTLPPVKQEEPRAEKTESPRHVPRKPAAVPEPEGYDLIVMEVLDILSELEQEQEQEQRDMATSPRRTLTRGGRRLTSPAQDSQNIQGNRDLVLGNIRNGHQASTSPLDIFKQKEDAEKENLTGANAGTGRPSSKHTKVVLPSEHGHTKNT